MIRLDHNNYYTRENTAISNSKVGDFLNSKEYYKAKHIDGTIESTTNPSMRIGSMADIYMSTGKEADILKEFSVRTLKRDDPELYEAQKTMNPDQIVSENEYNKAVRIGKRIVDSHLYKWFKDNKTEFQVILQGQYGGVDVCGMVDALTVIGNKVYIDDFKTSAPASMSNAVKWHFHCKDYGYYRQMAHYREMVAQMHPDKHIMCRHIVISNDDFAKVKLFTFAPETLVEPLKEFKSAVQAIVNEKDWVDEVPTWDDAIMLVKKDDQT